MSESIRSFCVQSPGLCAFICPSWQDCSKLPVDWVCESRRGRLVVIEDGGPSSTYEAPYEYCWHGDIPLEDRPDPEEEYVPEYPGDPIAALCRGCEARYYDCSSVAVTEEQKCRWRLKDAYRRYCQQHMQESDRPSDRHGRRMEPWNEDCADLIRADEELDETGTDIGAHHRKKVRQHSRQCEERLIDQCVAYYAQSHPEESNERTDQYKVSLRDHLGAEYSKTTTIRWDSSVGYTAGCRMVMDTLLQECLNQDRECRAKADPVTHCP